MTVDRARAQESARLPLGGEQLEVAVLGMGTMGVPMATNLAHAGFRTIAWNRSPDNLATLTEVDAVSDGSPAEAVRTADVVITMLPNAEATLEVAERGGLLDGLAPGSIWVQMGTIGIAATDDLAHLVADRRPDVVFVDAPVSGSKVPAETGELLILASGPPEVEAVLAPVFSAIGRRTLWLGGSGRGSRMKLVLNTWLAFLIEGVAECAVLAAELDISLQEFAQAVEGGPLAAAAALGKLQRIRDEDFRADFKLKWALKDVDLALGASEGVQLPATEAIDRAWKAAVDQGLGDLDLSAVWLAVDRSSI